MIKKYISLIVMIMLIGLSVPAHAVLMDRGNGLIYDSDQNITWLQNVNLAGTNYPANTFGVPGVLSSGQMAWSTSLEWVAGMNKNSFLGISNWRLPKTLPVNGSSYNYAFEDDGSVDMGCNISAPGSRYPYSKGSELAYMYYNNLGYKCEYALNGNSQIGYGVTNTGAPFINLDKLPVPGAPTVWVIFWSSTPYAGPSTYEAGDIDEWSFRFDVGFQYAYNVDHGFYVWPVVDGDPANPNGQPADTTPPTVPTGFTAVAVSSSEIELNWSPSTDNVRVVGYNIYRNGSLVASVTTGTSYSDTNLNASTTYSYSVSAYNTANIESAQSTPSVAATTFPPGTAITFISDLVWTSATTGWGNIIGINKSCGENGAGDGTTITLDGVTYAKGLGVHAQSIVTYNIAGQYSRFVSDIGIDDEVLANGGGGSVEFQVWGDGTKLYDSGSTSPSYITSGKPAQHINVSVAGVNTLTLKVLVGSTSTNDHGDWAGAYLVNGSSVYTPPPDITPPTVPGSVTAMAVSSSQIHLTWSASTDNVAVAGYYIYKNGSLSPGASVTTGTSYSDTALTASTTYSYTVSAYDAAGNVSAQSASASATTFPPGTAITFLSDLFWTSATNGWGPVEKDMSNGEQAAGDGHTITIDGVKYAKGIGCHAQSIITYNLAGNYSMFVSDIGIDDEVLAEGGGGSVEFQVWGDGTKLYDSGSTAPSYITSGKPAQHISVSVAGVNTLTLKVLVGSSMANDHADWAAAYLVNGSAGPAPAPDTTPPTIPGSLTATAASSSQINLTWSASTDPVVAGQVTSGVAGYKIYKNGSLTPLALVTTGTSYSDTGLAASTPYNYTVSAYDAAGNESAQSGSVPGTTLSTGSGSVFVSALTWTSATTGWGNVIGINKSCGQNGTGDGTTITLHGVKYAEGLGVHAQSIITYNIAGKYSRFISDIGIDDEVGGAGSVIFQVWGDGTKLYDSGAMSGSYPTQHINVSVAGVNTLQLIVLVGNTLENDHADWAGAELTY